MLQETTKLYYHQSGQPFFGDIQHILNYANAIGNDELYKIVEETIKQGYVLKNNTDSQPFDHNNWCVDITDPVNKDLLNGLKRWLNKQPQWKIDTPGYCFIHPYYGMYQGKSEFWHKDKTTASDRCQHIIPPLYTLPELQKHMPEIWREKKSSGNFGIINGDFLHTGKEYEFSDYPDFPENETVIMAYIGMNKDKTKYVGETPAGQFGRYLYIRPILKPLRERIKAILDIKEMYSADKTDAILAEINRG